MLLAIETSTSRSSVALADEDGTVVAAAELGRDRRHGEFVAPAIAEAMHHAGVGFEDLTAIGAGTGPGLYTGLRVGLVTAATIASTHELPCVGVPGPDAVAHRVRWSTMPIVVALDARRREVYVATYTSVDGEPAPDGPLTVGRPTDSLERLAALDGPFLLVGDGTDAVLRAAEEQGVALDARRGGPETAQPLATDVAQLGVRAVAAGGSGPPSVLTPVYLRDADASIGWDQRGRLRGGAAS